MKSVLFVAFAVLFVAAAPVEAIEPEGDLAKVERALAAWKTARTECGGDYSYTIRNVSFTGFGSETTIVVRDNKVTERSYRTFSNRPVLPGEAGADQTMWTEEGDAIGSHRAGAPAKTLDELYAAAKETANAELPDFSRRYVRTNDRGLLTSCFTIDTRIADDAPINGFSITKIELNIAE